MHSHARSREVQLYAMRLAITIVFVLVPFVAKAQAQVAGRFPNSFPKASITSDETDAAGAPEPEVDEDVPPPVESSPATHRSRAHHHPAVSEPSYSAAVEPTHAMLKLKKDAWAYAGPENSSPTLERVHAGKFINVTGSTHYFVQVKLKNGTTGYVPISNVDLIRPADKVMRLSTDASVLSQPNRYGKRLSEVHQGHDIHVVGVSMNYMKIRMKSGLEGYIPLTAAE